MRKILCFLGIHQYTKYEKLRNMWGNNSKDYMIMCKNCRKVKFKSENKTYNQNK